jgi:FdhE protein
MGMDLARVDALAADVDVDPGRLRGLIGLVAMPLLQACGRRLNGQIPAAWSAGYCGVCGAWPALAEERGLERQKRLRCGRCGGDWRTEWQQCPFCGVSDHRRLGALVSDSHGEARKAETCEGCRGYVKTLATLQPWPAETVAIEDVATVDLDVAALARGYSRPERPGYVLGARVVAGPDRETLLTAGRRRFFRRRS